eukprot:GHVU01046169.1.p2 GENE.GHVU01046169.1~~GHVU01046169.1.p2  ORF type:complete len:112 (-),score=1.15 GHVU01046169.1:245-580(-)
MYHSLRVIYPLSPVCASFHRALLVPTHFQSSYTHAGAHTRTHAGTHTRHVCASSPQTKPLRSVDLKPLPDRFPPPCTPPLHPPRIVAALRRPPMERAASEETRGEIQFDSI